MMRPVMTLALLSLLSTLGVAQQTFAFVDVERCFKEYKKAIEIDKLMKTEVDEKLRALDEGRRKIAAMREQLDLYTRGSDPWVDLTRKIKLEEVTNEVEQATVKFKTSKKLAGELAKLYEDIRREIKAIAESKGIKAVFIYIGSPVEGDSPPQVMNNIMVRPVLYFDPSLDLTADVVARLNK